MLKIRKGKIILTIKDLIKDLNIKLVYFSNNYVYPKGNYNENILCSQKITISWGI